MPPQEKNRRLRCFCCCRARRSDRSPSKSKSYFKKQIAVGTQGVQSEVYVAKQEVHGCADQWAGSVLTNAHRCTEASEEMAGAKAQAASVHEAAAPQAEHMLKDAQADDLEAQFDISVSAHNSPREEDSQPAHAIDPIPFTQPEDVGGGIRRFLEMPTPEKVGVDSSNAGSASTGVAGSSTEAERPSQLGRVSTWRLPWRRQSTSASLAADFPVVGTGCVADVMETGDVLCATEASAENTEETQAMVLKLVDRIAQLETQLQQHTTELDGACPSNLVASSHTPELAPDKLHELIGIEISTLDDDEEGVAVTPVASAEGTQDLVPGEQLPAEQSGWSNPLQKLREWLQLGLGDARRQLTEEEHKEEHKEAHADEAESSNPSAPSSDLAVMDALDQLVLRVAELEEHRQAVDDDPAVADTLRGLARRVVDLEHQRSRRKAQPAFPPSPGAFTAPPFMLQSPNNVAATKGPSLSAEELASTEVPELPSLQISMPVTAPVPMPELASPFSTNLSAVNSDVGLAHPLHGVARQNSMHGSPSKWADPSFGVVSAADSETHAPRVPRGRFGIRSFLRPPSPAKPRRERKE